MTTSVTDLDWPIKVDIRSARMQCPACGAPVDVASAVMGQDQMVLLDPCGHQVPVTA